MLSSLCPGCLDRDTSGAPIGVLFVDEPFLSLSTLGIFTAVAINFLLVAMHELILNLANVIAVGHAGEDVWHACERAPS